MATKTEALAAKERFKAEILPHRSDVTGVGIGRLTGGNGPGCNVVRVLVQKPGKNPPRYLKDIPQSIDGVPVVVVESGEIKASGDDNG